MPSSGVKTCARSEEHTSELQSHDNLVCRLLLEKNTRRDSRRVLAPPIAGPPRPRPPPRAGRARPPPRRQEAASPPSAHRQASEKAYFFKEGAPPAERDRPRRAVNLI